MNNQQDKKNLARRKLLKSVVAGGSVLATGKILPQQWAAPLVESVQLPAHAAGSPGPDQFDGVFIFSQAQVQSEAIHVAGREASAILDMFVPPAQAVVSCDLAIEVIVVSVDGALAKVCLVFDGKAYESSASVNQDTRELSDIINIGCSNLDMKDMMISADGDAIHGMVYKTGSTSLICTFQAPRGGRFFFCRPVNVTATSILSSPYPLET